MGVRTKGTARGTALHALAILFAAAIGASGCAIKKDGNNRLLVGLDGAAIIGTEHAQFNLNDGSVGTLRSLGDSYSLKLEKFFHVIPLGTAQNMKLVQAVQIEDRAVLVIHRLDKSGCIKTSLLAIRGSEALNWLITPDDCKSVPNIAMSGSRMVLTYAGSRFTYEDGRGLHETLAVPSTTVPAPAAEKPQASARAPRAPGAAPVKTAPASVPVASNTRRAASPPAPQNSKPAAPRGPAPATAAKGLPDLKFGGSAREEKPVVIHLE